MLLFSAPTLAGIVAVLGLIQPGTAEFSSECRQISLINGEARRFAAWLYAECPDSLGAWVQSTAFLGHWIVNRESVMQVIFHSVVRFCRLTMLTELAVLVASGVSASAVPRLNDNNKCQFLTRVLVGHSGAGHRTCYNCVVSAGAVLNCDCMLPTRRLQPSSIDLDEHFFNSNGTIKSDLLGPMVPSPHNDVPVPSTFVHSYHPTDDQACAVHSLFDRENSVEPTKCMTLRYILDLPALAVYFSLNPGYRLQAYAGDSCTGPTVGTVGPGNGNQCVVFSGAALSVSVLPTWNSI
jgi:hypothetical protein